MNKLYFFSAFFCFGLTLFGQPIQTESGFFNNRTLLTAPLSAVEVGNANSIGAVCQSFDGESVFFIKESEKGIELFQYFSQKNYAASLGLMNSERPSSIIDLGNKTLLVGVNKGIREDFYRFDLNSNTMIDSSPYLSNAMIIHQQISKSVVNFVVNVKGQDFIFYLGKDQKVPTQVMAIEGQLATAFFDEQGVIQGYVSLFEKGTHIYKIEKRASVLKVKRDGRCKYNCINYNPKSGELIVLSGNQNGKSSNSIEKINLNTGKIESVIDSKSKSHLEIVGWKFNKQENKFDFISTVSENGKAQNLTYTSTGKTLVDRVTNEFKNQNLFLHNVSERTGSNVLCAFNENFPSQFLLLNSTQLNKINTNVSTSNFYSSIPIFHRTYSGASCISYLYMPKVEKESKLPVVYLLNSNPLNLHSKQLNAKAQYLVSNGFIVIMWNTHYSTSNSDKEEISISESLSRDLFLLNEELINQDYSSSISGIVIGENNSAALVPFAIGNSSNALLHGLTMSGALHPKDQNYIKQLEGSANAEWPEFGTMKFTSEQQFICIGTDKSNEATCNELKEFQINAKYLEKNVNNNAGSLSFLLSRLNEVFQSQGVYNK